LPQTLCAFTQPPTTQQDGIKRDFDLNYFFKEIFTKSIFTQFQLTHNQLFMLNKSLKISLVLLCQLVVFSSFGQTATAHVLFSPTLRTEDKSFQSEQLSPTENRMRIVRLLPFGSGKTIDLSQPLRLTLFDNVEYTVQLKRQTGTYLDNMEVWYGRVADSRFDHLPHYINTVFVVNPTTHKLVANIETNKGLFQILPTIEAGLYRIRDCKGLDGSNCGAVEEKAHAHRQDGLQLRTDCGSVCSNETNAAGTNVVDVFAGYSDATAALAGDLNAHAQANIETVNTGLSNSLVTTVILRLVGTGTTPNNPGIITSVLTDCKTWFAEQIETLAPDAIAVFLIPTGAAGEKGGWGNTGGSSLASVNGAGYPNAFRHEFGHNAGGSHCFPDNNSYKNGHSNGNWQTHLCGNNVNFYSNPSINDNLGNPIGNAAQADMARTFRERASEMAKISAHRVPYFAGDACNNQVCVPIHWGNQNEIITRVVFNTIDNNQVAAGWNCATTTGYSDFTNLSTNVNRNANYTISIVPNYSFANSKVGVWIDFNQDGILSSTEKVGNFSGIGYWTAPIAIPATAALGNARLRVRFQYGTPGSTISSCETASSGGETEDYTVNITAQLPISLTNFSGQNTEGSNFLNWQTETEIQSSHFDVERSLNGQDFDKIATVKALGKANIYALSNKITTQNTQYYRLKMVDNDGSFQYSKIIALRADNHKNNQLLNIHPNPVTQFLIIETTEEGDQQVINLLGQIVLRSKATQQMDVSALPSGTYILKVGSQQAKFVKQ
jgi:GEVED domain/Secretion system C-terminal sorting domain